MPPVLEKKILTSLLFTESFDTIIEEAKESEFLVADVLKDLIKSKYVSPMVLNEETQEYESTYMYDSDNMRAYHYQMTAKGLNFLGQKF
jgi:hypothetical protein